MIAATLLSFSASLVVAVIAARNGQKATQIAKDASDRERTHREAEDERREHAERYAAAAAMAKAIWALEAAISHSVHAPGSDEAIHAQLYANRLKHEAMVEIELLHPREYPVELALWFERTTLRMGQLTKDLPTRNAYRGEANGSVRRWKSRIVSVKQFLDPNRAL